MKFSGFRTDQGRQGFGRLYCITAKPALRTPVLQTSEAAWCHLLSPAGTLLVQTGQSQQGCRGQGAEKPCFRRWLGGSSTEKEAAGPTGKTMNLVSRVLEALSSCQQAGVQGYKAR